jgi:hypothetical protein
MHGKGDGMANDPKINILEELQKRFAIIDLSGEIRVLDLDEIAKILNGILEGSPSMYKKNDAELMLKRHLESLPIASNLKEVISNFWISPKTIVYKSLAFTPLKTSVSTLNLWVGPTTTGKQGNCSTIKNFLLDIICNGDQSSYNYLIRYLAHMLQHPEDKPGVMIVMLSGQGTGKGTFFKLLRSIWSRTTLQVSDVQEVIGQFNAALERSYVICMDEALFAGDKKALDRLKSLITEPIIRIEQKYQPSRNLVSYHRIFAASNHDHFANVEQDDRRFFILRLSCAKQGDYQYFEKLNKAILNSREINAFVSELLDLDLSNFNIFKKPTTEELIDQKIQSLSGFERYWFEVLTTCNLTGIYSEYVTEWRNPFFIATSDIKKNYQEFDKKADMYRSIQENAISKSLQKICPSAHYDRVQNKFKGQKRGYLLPSIFKARMDFDNYIGGKIDWPELSDNDIGLSEVILKTLWEGFENGPNFKKDTFEQDIIKNWHAFTEED